MKEEWEKLYEEYFNKRLDLIFDETSGESYKVYHFSNEKYIMSSEEIRNEELIKKRGYQSIRDYYCGIAIVKKANGKYNYIDEEGNEISPIDFDYAWDFYQDGYAAVGNKLNELNMLGRDGKLVSDKWYKSITSFTNGFARVRRNDGKFNFINQNGDEICDEWFDYVNEKVLFHEGLSIVGKIDQLENWPLGFGYATININGIKYHQGNKILWTYLKTDGKPLTKEWYLEAAPFNEGVAIVKNLDGTSSVINKEGKKLFTKANIKRYVTNFHSGVAVVELKKDDGLFNCIDLSGNIIFAMAYKEIKILKSGIMLLWDENKRYTFANSKGEMLGSGYTEAEIFEDGLYRVKNRHGVYNLVDENTGMPISDEWFYAIYFNGINGNNHGIYAVQCKKNEYNYINREGQKLLLENVGSVWQFKNGVAVIEDNNCKDSFINLSGKPINDDKYDDVCRVDKDGILAWVKKNGRYRYIDYNGKPIGPMWFKKISSSGFIDGYVEVNNDRYKKNIMDIHGNLISNTWYDQISFSEKPGIFKVQDDNLQNYINTDGEVLYKWYKEVNLIPYWTCNGFETYSYGGNHPLPNFTKTICRNKDLKDFQVESTRKGYQCVSPRECFTVKFEPIMIYDKKLALCINKRKIYLFNRENGKYTEIGTISNVEISNDLLRIGEKINLVYNGEIIDITNYYNKNIRDKEVYHINKGIELLSANDFYIGNEEDIKERARKVLEENNRIKEELRKKRELEQDKKKLQELAIASEKEKKAREIKEQEALHMIGKYMNILREMAETKGHRDRVPASGLIIWVNDHREIREELVKEGLLEFADLSGENFYKVMMRGHNFAGQNLPALNPQLVYKKDLSNCNFEGVYFHVSKDFTGVDIRGSKFTCDDKASTFDINERALAKGIYDETTLLNGVPLTELINEKNQSRRV